MATRDTGGQTHGQRRTEEEIEEIDTSDVAARKEKLDDDIDSLLDEIDDVIEENAEDFVRGFVQKGGQ